MIPLLSPFNLTLEIQIYKARQYFLSVNFWCNQTPLVQNYDFPRTYKGTKSHTSDLLQCYLVVNVKASLVGLSDRTPFAIFKHIADSLYQ